MDGVKNKVLIIDDNEDDYLMLKRYLKSDFDCKYSDGQDDIFETLNKHNPSCLLLDYNLGTENGIDLLKKIKADKSYSTLPVIMLTNEKTPEVIIECMKSGAEDYLLKDSLDVESTIRTVNHVLKTADLEKKIQDQQEQILALSRTDELTGVYARRYFQEKVDDEIERCNRNNTFFSLTILDVDYFKDVNDTFGHLIGDEILISVAKAISQSIRKVDYLGRFGGDEFMIVLVESSDAFSEEKYNEHIKKYDQIRKVIKTQIAKKINEIRKTININTETDFSNKIINITASFGVAYYDKSVSDYDELMSRADKSLYLAKESGRNCIGYYQDGKSLTFTDQVFL